jgi:hypothetical protein
MLKELFAVDLLPSVSDESLRRFHQVFLKSVFLLLMLLFSEVLEHFRVEFQTPGVLSFV